MPTTPAQLAEVGLREVPAWWDVTANGLLLGERHLYGHGYHHQHRHPHGHAHGPAQHGNHGLLSRPHALDHNRHHQHGNNSRHGLGHTNGHGKKNHQHNPWTSLRDLLAGAGAGVDAMGTDPGLGLGLGASAAGAEEEFDFDFDFDPRDPLAGVLPPSGIRPSQFSPYGYALGGGSGGNGGLSKRAMKELRGRMALLRGLGLAGDASAGPARGRKRETNPLQRGRGGRGVGKEGFVRAGATRVEMAAPTTPAAAVAASAGEGDVAGAGVSAAASGVGVGCNARRAVSAEVAARKSAVEALMKAAREEMATVGGAGAGAGAVASAKMAAAAAGPGAGAGGSRGRAGEVGRALEKMVDHGKTTGLADAHAIPAQMAKLVDV